MDNTYYDIVIIGAGLSGLSAALASTREQQLSIAIIESKSIGANNPSPLTFKETIQRFKLTDCIKEHYASFSFHNYNGSRIHFNFSDSPLVVLDYKKACHNLFKRIKRTAKIDFIPSRVQTISQNTKEAVVELADNEKLYSQVLIDSSGKSQLQACNFNKTHSSFYSHVFGAVFSNVKEGEKRPCCFLWPNSEFGSGGGWYYSLGGNKASFGYATISNSPVYDIKKFKNRLDLARRKFRPYSEYLESATIEHYEKGSIPINYIDKFVCDHIIAVGDAAGMATNWTCMGVEPALVYGTICGELSAKSILNNQLPLLMEFQKIWEKKNKETYDAMASITPSFWESDSNVWEWIMKHDISYLTPVQILERMRFNKHILKKHQIVSRIIKSKVKSIFSRGGMAPINLGIEN